MPIGDDGRGGAAATQTATAAAALVLAVVAMLTVFRSLSLAMPSAGLDGSWIAVLGEAALRPARWGVDLAFTYGPASAVVTGYFTNSYLATIVPFVLAMASVEGFAFALLARRAAEGARSPGALVVLAAAVQAAALVTQAAPDQIDGFVFATALAVALLDLVRRPGGRTARSWSGRPSSMPQRSSRRPSASRPSACSR